MTGFPAPFPFRPDDPDDLAEWDFPRPEVQVEMTENPIVAVLYGPDGDVILEMRERSEVTFGFQPPTADACS